MNETFKSRTLFNKETDAIVQNLKDAWERSSMMMKSPMGKSLYKNSAAVHK